MSEYTPEQLRERATKMESRLDPTSDPTQLRAHADALEALEKERIAHTATGHALGAQCQSLFEKLKIVDEALERLREDGRTTFRMNGGYVQQQCENILAAIRGKPMTQDEIIAGRHANLQEAP